MNIEKILRENSHVSSPHILAAIVIASAIESAAERLASPQKVRGAIGSAFVRRHREVMSPSERDEFDRELANDDLLNT